MVANSMHSRQTMTKLLDNTNRLEQSHWDVGESLASLSQRMSAMQLETVTEISRLIRQESSGISAHFDALGASIRQMAKEIPDSVLRTGFVIGAEQGLQELKKNEDIKIALSNVTTTCGHSLETEVEGSRYAHPSPSHPNSTLHTFNSPAESAQVDPIFVDGTQIRPFPNCRTQLYRVPTRNLFGTFIFEFKLVIKSIRTFRQGSRAPHGEMSYSILFHPSPWLLRCGVR